MKENKAIEKKFKTPIFVVSIIIPLAVVLLFTIRLKDFGIQVEPLSFLPPIYAAINGITAILLILAVNAIKNGKRALHKKLMTYAISCSVVFLLMYVAYHMTAEATKFGGQGVIRYIYFFLLITHIALSVIIIPLVLFTYVMALSGQLDKHKKLARITFPLWLYVAVTGVIVYLMIAPYYAS